MVDAQQKSTDYALGKSHDLEGTVKSVEEANLAMSMTMSMRTKMLQAYSEISQIAVLALRGSRLGEHLRVKRGALREAGPLLCPPACRIPGGSTSGLLMLAAGLPSHGGGRDET